MLLRNVFLLVVTAALAGTVTAQRTNERSSSPARIVSFGFGPAANMIPAIKNAPFSGMLTLHKEQTLNDGTLINHDDQEIVMRDSRGRIYRARTIHPTGATHEVQLIVLLDPARHVEYLCTPLKVCRTIRYRDSSGFRHPPGFNSRKDLNLTREDLGAANMSGVDVEGKRVTRTVPEGTVGNDRPFSVIEETWHSNQLDLDIQLKRTDPRMGTHTTTMTNIVIGEPDEKYFEIPEGYRVEPGHEPVQPRPLEPFGTGGAEPGPREP